MISSTECTNVDVWNIQLNMELNWEGQHNCEGIMPQFNSFWQFIYTEE